MSTDRPGWLTDEVCRVTGTSAEDWEQDEAGWWWSDPPSGIMWTVDDDVITAQVAQDGRAPWVQWPHDGTTDGIRAALLRVASMLRAEELTDLLVRVTQERGAYRMQCGVLEEELAEERGSRVAWCPECEAEMEACDEDRCCEGCGVDLIIYADRHSAELGSNLVANLLEVETIHCEDGAEVKLHLAQQAERAEAAEHRADLAEARANEAEGEMHDLRDRVAELKAQVSMACESPCGDCAGCMTAAHHYAEEADHD